MIETMKDGNEEDFIEIVKTVAKVKVDIDKQMFLLKE